MTKAAQEDLFRDYPAYRGHSEEVVELALLELGYVKPPPDPNEQPRLKEEKKKPKPETVRRRVRAALKELHPRPPSCPQCGSGHRLHLHHDYPSWQELKAQGDLEDLSKHNVRWLCHRCRAKAHAGEPAERIISAPGSVTI